MDDISAIWNAILSVAVGCFVWWVRGQKSEFQNVYDMIGETRKRVSDTREEIAKNYVTKIEAEADRQEILKRFDKIDAKLDALILKTRST
jgi:hypothetical protein